MNFYVATLQFAQLTRDLLAIGKFLVSFMISTITARSCQADRVNRMQLSRREENVGTKERLH